MKSEFLSTYLNDHLAGSVAALELLDHLARTAVTPDTQQFFTSLHREVAEDQQVLRDLLQRLGRTESPLRKAGAWLTEKLGELKLRVDDPAEGPLRQLEALETLALGIQGKLALWRTLEVVSDQVTEGRDVDLARLQRRAGDQYTQVESRRLAAARTAFGGPVREMSGPA